MAQVTTGTVKTGTMWYSTFYTKWSRKSYSSKDNTSTIDWEAGLITSNGVYWLSNAVKINSVTINGTKVLSNKTYSNISGNGTHKLASGTLTIKHNDDGNKSFEVSMSGWLYENGNTSGKGSFELPTIPRYLTIDTFNISNITETSAIVNWSVSDPRNSTYYSLDGGTTWIGSATDGESLASDNKSGSFNITGLTANTSYNIKIKIKRTDTELWTESSSKSFTTYNYPHCTSAPNFTIGNKLTLGFYNPLGRTFKLEVIGANNVVQSVSNYNTTTVEGFNNTSWLNYWYSTIPNAKSGTYKVKVTYGSSAITKTGGTYSIKGNETPTVGTITYADTNTTVTAITGNNQHIVQNQSNLKVTYASATGKNSATIKSYSFTLNGVTKTSTSAGGTVDFGKINSSNNLTLTTTVTDSRGLTASATKTITILAHSSPNAVVSLKRLNNYEDETYLTVDGSVSSVNSKNTMAIKYRYKVSGGTYSGFVGINDNAKQTLSLDKNNSYIFNVVVTDAFGSTYNKEHVLNKGVFPLFIDTVLNSIGINMFPSSKNALEIQGIIKIPKNKDLGIKNADGQPILADYGNANVVLNATSGVLYLGYIDTTGINFLNGKITIDEFGAMSITQLKSRVFGENLIYSDSANDTDFFGKGNSTTTVMTVLRGNNVRLYSHSGGAVYLGATGSIAVNSDENLKDIFEIDEKYINFFNDLKPISYIYKDNGHRNHIGFGARQVEQALLDAGLTTEQFAGVLKDTDVTISADEMGTEENVHYDELYSLRYEEFIALNTLMIQNQAKEINLLKEQIKELQNQIAELKAGDYE